MGNNIRDSLWREKFLINEGSHSGFDKFKTVWRVPVNETQFPNVSEQDQEWK